MGKVSTPPMTNTSEIGIMSARGAKTSMPSGMPSVLSVVSQTNMVAIAPEWLAKEFEEQFALQLLPLPLEMNSRTCYLSWHETAAQERSHRWMAELLINICQR